MKTRDLLVIAALTAPLAAFGGEAPMTTAFPAKPAAEGASATADTPVATKKPKACEPVSGSHIRPSTARNCETLAQPMRSYSAEDIQRTGEMNLAQALRKLDPIFF